MKRATLLLMAMCGYIAGYSQVYDYPVKPGTARWKQLQTLEEKYKVCQIPPATLAAMPTKDLLQTCLNFPLLINMAAHNDVQTGFTAMATHFNGLQTLLARKDAGIILLEAYQQTYAGGFSKAASLVQQGDYAFRLQTLEVMLAQESIQARLTPPEKRTLIKAGVEKFNDKEKESGVYGGYATTISAWLVARVLHSEKRSSEVSRQRFLDRPQATDRALALQVIQEASAYLK